jgi:acetyl-CoA/propionyl-CoA carboxylase biotin carboxyl carrier protein
VFETVLVANRGEIAVRVIRTLRRLGIRSVAVYSDADTDALQTAEADTAVHIGPTPATESYLSIQRLLDAASRTGAQAVHPGYGFLAENPAFARACEAAGLAFIGPPASAIELMGDKIRAKETVRAAGVPVVPGSSGSGLTDAQLIEAARKIGTPVLLKPSAGGGGKGMRLVRNEALLADEIAAARREARGAFGDDTLLVERWIDRPRHIEIQVLADAHGHIVHLGERECSLQRRHQKVIEESPSVLLDESTRAAMGEAAIQAARCCGYVGAGTVEFIVPGTDPAAHSFNSTKEIPYFFMEMNTRLQVEHPVTELVTGLDLVEWQLRIAAGERLAFSQQDITLTGHAIEARVCAESARIRGPVSRGPGQGAASGPSPGGAEKGGAAEAAPTDDNQAGRQPGRRDADPLLTGPLSGERLEFLPSSGTVLAVDEPHGEGVRIDSGLRTGSEVGTAYDPMLAKVIAHGPDRPTALRRLRAALAGTTVLGVETNTGFLRRLLAHPAVISGDLDTGLIDHEAKSLVEAAIPDEVYAAAALLRHAALHPGPAADGWTDPFSVPNGWRVGGQASWTAHHLRVPGHQPVAVHVRDGEVRVGTADPVAATLDVDGQAGGEARLQGRAVLHWDGVSHVFRYADDWLACEGDSWHVKDHDPVEAALSGRAAAAHAGTLTAPMPGTVTVVKVAPGDTVACGQSLLVVEAMKMEHIIAAPHDGTVARIDITPGSTVAMDQVLAVITPAAAAQEES